MSPFSPEAVLAPHSAWYQRGIGALDALGRPVHSQRMGIAVLGPLLIDGNTNLGRRDRVVLSALAVRPGEPLRLDQLVDALWGDRPPASAAKVVQGCIVRLRKELGSAAIVTGPSGYGVAVPLDEVDAQALRAGRRPSALTASLRGEQ